MLLPDPVLSVYGALSTEPSPAGRMMGDFAASYREERDVNLGVGYVSEEAIPRLAISEALCAVLADSRKYRAALNYGGPSGSPNLEASLRDFLRRQRPAIERDALSRRRLIVGASGVTSLLEALASVLAPGVVVTSEPLYYIYCDLLRRLGYSLCAIPEDREGIRTDLLAECLEQRTDEVRFCYVVTVGNPTSTVLSNRRRRELVELVNRTSERRKRKLLLVMDLAYEPLVHDPSLPALESALGADTHGVVYEVGSLSKVLAPALRIGYLLAPPGPLCDALVQRTSDVGFSAPLVTQEIASYLLDHLADAHLAEVRRAYRRKALAVRHALDAAFGDALEEVAGGQAGFYYYLTLGDTLTLEGSAFHRHATRTTGDPGRDGPAENLGPRVLYLPGIHCIAPGSGAAERGQRQLRLSYGFEPLAAIERGVHLLGEALDYSRSVTVPGNRARVRTSRPVG